MAGTCGVCGGKIPWAGGGSLPDVPGVDLCTDCYLSLRGLTGVVIPKGELMRAGNYLTSKQVESVPPEMRAFLERKGIEFEAGKGWSAETFMQKEQERIQTENRAKAEAAAKKAREEQRNMLMTTTPQVAGHKITAYLGIVSGETIFGMGMLTAFTAGVADVFGEESDRYSDKMRKARDSATSKMRNEAKGRGANAIVGIGLEHSSFGDMVGVCATGTAVIIEPEDASEA
ncbi:MAG: YbjQ family protein [Eggerthellaceae bacterium]|nr:YbjQ family protein [Eggerthellaceae bacterium]